MKSYQEKFDELVSNLEFDADILDIDINELRADGINYFDIDPSMYELYLNNMKRDMRKLYNAYIQLMEALIDYAKRHNL